MQDVPDGTGGACPRVQRPEDKAGNAAGEDCSRAHRAGFQSYYQRAVIESPAAADATCRTQGNYLGVPGWVGAGLADIATAGDGDPVPVHNDSANWDLGRASASRRPRLGQRSPHRGLKARQVTSHLSARVDQSAPMAESSALSRA